VTEKKIYFASDQHFGIPDRESSAEREKIFIRWLDDISADAEAIYLMGDLFDFWFEYKTVIQRGYVRLFGKLAALVDVGIPVFYFRGNHDIWAFDYLEKEIGLRLHRKELIVNLKGKRFFLAHGDGLGRGDKGYKFIKKVFECRFNQWIFRWLHPDWGTRMGWFWSRRSRYSNDTKEIKNIEKEGVTLTEASMKKRLTDYCKQVLKTEHIDYFIFGHYHQPIIYDLTPETKIITIGDWIKHFSYGVFDGEKFELIKNYGV
jgi:UDP-2,3-diacylglucosamine hydrolase